MSDAEPLVTVATFPSLMEAELAKGILDGKGIRSFLADGELVNMAWYMSGAVGGVKLQVANSDFRAAERLLNNLKSESRSRALDDYGLGKPRDAITADPDVMVHDAQEDEGDDESERETTADAEVDRAWKAAIFGLLLLPPLLHIYSALILLTLSTLSTAVSPAKRGRLWAAILVDAAVLSVVGLIMLWILVRTATLR